MQSNILDEAREYLITFLEGKVNRLETRHPWRKDWKSMVLHSLRVETYVLKILAEEEHDFTDMERRSLQLSAILHDIGRLEKTANHATTGAEIAGRWLQNDPEGRLQPAEIERVIELIADHSNKDHRETDICKAVLKDADILDEIGAMSIFMAGNWLDAKSPFFFYDLRQRLVEVEIPFCDRQLPRLNTKAARKMLNEKKTFIENFIAQLSDELQANSQIASTLLTR